MHRIICADERTFVYLHNNGRCCALVLSVQLTPLYTAQSTRINSRTPPETIRDKSDKTRRLIFGLSGFYLFAFERCAPLLFYSRTFFIPHQHTSLILTYLTPSAYFYVFVYIFFVFFAPVFSWWS